MEMVALFNAFKGRKRRDKEMKNTVVGVELEIGFVTF